MMSISFRAFVPGKDFDYSTISDVKDPGWMMIVPLVIFVIVMLIFGLHSGPLVDIFTGIAAEL